MSAEFLELTHAGRDLIRRCADLEAIAAALKAEALTAWQRVDALQTERDGETQRLRAELSAAWAATGLDAALRGTVPLSRAVEILRNP